MNLQPSGHARAGAMTAVMRAAAVPADVRVPRIAVVLAGRIVEERLFRDAAAISIGTAEDVTFTLPASAGVPERFVLLERVGSKHYLRFTDAMTGRLALGAERLDLDELRARAHEARGAWRVELSADARGKIAIGDATFLLQLVPAPPLPAQPRLPLGVLDGLGARIDWRLAMIAAMSFLLHFAVVGGVYSDWLDPVIDDERSIAALVDMKPYLPDVPVEPTTTTDEAPSAPAASEPKVAAPTKTPTNADHGVRRPPAHDTRAMSDSRAADIAARADAMEMGYVTSLNGGPATRAAVDGRDTPPVDLSRAAESQRGVAERGSPIDGAHGGPVARGKDGLASLAGVRGNASDHAGHETNVVGPKIAVDVAPPVTTGPAPTDADRVVAGLRARFRRCYERGLDADPRMSGKAVLAAKVAPNGEVASVDVAENAGLSPQVTSCLAQVVRGAQFSHPDHRSTGKGSFATVRIPVTFVQQR